MLGLAGLLCALLLAAGCEVESSTADVNITPSSATLHHGESRTFTANGGYEYRWSLKEPTWGMLSTLTGPETTYTSRYTPTGTNTVASQTLTVTSTITGVPQNNATNSYSETATAIIVHASATSP
jgi:hypothetical protein